MIKVFMAKLTLVNMAH